MHTDQRSLVARSLLITGTKDASTPASKKGGYEPARKVLADYSNAERILSRPRVTELRRNGGPVR